jgi:hypothetical protein
MGIFYVVSKDYFVRILFVIMRSYYWKLSLYQYCCSPLLMAKYCEHCTVDCYHLDNQYRKFNFNLHNLVKMEGTHALCSMGRPTHGFSVLFCPFHQSTPT